MLRSDHSAFLTLRLLLLVALLALAAGCSPKIGDKCTVSTDCSATGDRLCDITEPGGYCTEFNCEPDGCPDNAACINFGTVLSPIDQCSTSQGNSPYQRSFCMASCSSDSDCRSGYVCLNLKEPNALGAELVDYAGNGLVCAVKPIADNPADPDGGMPASNQVCLGSYAGSGGASSATGGAGGMSGGGASGADNAGADNAGAGG